MMSVNLVHPFDGSFWVEAIVSELELLFLGKIHPYHFSLSFMVDFLSPPIF